VTAKWERWKGHAYLGGSSYKNEEEFCQPGGYFEGMKQEALDDLNQEIAKVKSGYRKEM
jgi:hypothetical protein